MIIELEGNDVIQIHARNKKISLFLDDNGNLRMDGW